jgi:hypothetical protein
MTRIFKTGTFDGGQKYGKIVRLCQRRDVVFVATLTADTRRHHADSKGCDPEGICFLNPHHLLQKCSFFLDYTGRYFGQRRRLYETTDVSVQVSGLVFSTPDT